MCLMSLYQDKACFSFLVENLDLFPAEIKDNLVADYISALSQKRSLQSLLNGSLPDSLKKNVSKKTIWFFWLQGLENAPEVVQISYKSWVAMNPDYDVIFLDASNIHTYFPYWDSFSISNLHLKIAHKSDFLRTFLIHYYGGIWVDATTFCFKSLASWLPNVLENNPLFFPKQPKKCKDRLIKNWLIAGTKDNIFTKLLLNKLFAYIFLYRKSPTKMLHAYAYMPKCKSQDIDLTPDYFTKSCLERFDSEGFFPYYFYHYIYNDIVSESEKGSSIKKISSFISRYPNITPGNKQASLSESVFVTKQSYRQKHLDSNEYKERKSLILGLINSSY